MGIECFNKRRYKWFAETKPSTAPNVSLNTIKTGTLKRNIFPIRVIYVEKMLNGVLVPNKKYKLQMELEHTRKHGPVATTESKRLHMAPPFYLMLSVKNWA